MAKPGSGVVLYKRSEVTNWYYEKDLSSLLSPADDAYTEARQFFTSNLIPSTDRFSVTKWLSTTTTLSDFHTTIAALQAGYESKSLSKASKPRQWLHSCAERVAFYGSIMDVLSQHHPEYVSLAWGAFKFLFTAVLNYETLMTSIAKTFSRIADILPRADLHLRLYTTKSMLADVAKIYASILRFVCRATNLYSKNRVQRSVSAIIKPFEISFKDIVEEIGECSRRVDERANAAMKAELRDLHIEMMQMRESTNAALTQIRSDIHSQSHQFTNHQQSQALISLHRSSDENPVASLDFYRSLMRRRKPHVFRYQRKRGSPWPKTLTKALQTWSSADESNILLIKGSQFIAPAHDVAVDVIDLVQEAKVPIWWVMTTPGDGDDTVQIQIPDIFRMLLVQALGSYANSNADVFKADTVFPVTPSHIQSAQTDPNLWPKLFGRVISNLAPQVFIAVETSALQQQRDGKPYVLELISQLQEMCNSTTGTRVKVVVADRYHLQDLQRIEFPSTNVSIVSVDPRKNFRHGRAGRLTPSHIHNRTVPRDDIAFTMTTPIKALEEEEEEDWG